MRIFEGFNRRLKFSLNFIPHLFNSIIAMFSGLFSRIFNFYANGFRSLPNWGKQVWLVILIKLFVIFFILKLFFFPNILKTNFKNDSERSEHVLENLTNINK